MDGVIMCRAMCSFILVTVKGTANGYTDARNQRLSGECWLTFLERPGNGRALGLSEFNFVVLTCQLGLATPFEAMKV